MQGRIRSISGYTSAVLAAGWHLAEAPPNAYSCPADALAGRVEWLPATVPGTAADALRALGRWSLDGPPRRFDGNDWWYATTFSAPEAEQGSETWLCFDGLATVADVWLNDSPLLASDNMFVSHSIRVDALLQERNSLAIRFRSLDGLLRAKRPRPRWRSPMVENQQLRWFRTTLLGRTPGWSPPAAAVGPWRGVTSEQRRNVRIADVMLTATVQGADEGLLEVACSIESIGPGAISSARLTLNRDAERHVAQLVCDGHGSTYRAHLRVPRVALWWPHTHGDQARYHASLEIGLKQSSSPISVDLGPVGFRSVALRTESGDFEFTINGIAVFCRGACWTPLDAAYSTACSSWTRDMVIPVTRHPKVFARNTDVPPTPHPMSST